MFQSDIYDRLAEEAKWCLDNGDSCWKRGLDEETIRAVSKFNLTDLVMRRFGNSWGLLQKTGRFETYLPVGTFPRGWYVSLVCQASRVP